MTRPELAAARVSHSRHLPATSGGSLSLIGAAVAAVTLGLASLDASALALGQINVQSSIGEPLRAEINVTEISPGEADGMRVNIGSAEAYGAAGVAYNQSLADVRAALQRRPDGRYVIRLTSTRSFSEPFVDLLLEANWGAGRIVRDYTLLLDPPVRPSTATAIAPTLPQISPAPARRPLPETTTRRSRPAAAAPVETPRAAAAAAGGAGGQLTVQSGDTAYRIAVANKPAGISLDQMLVALLRTNPSAFVNGNVNRMRAGAVIELPSAAQAEAVTPDEARRTVVAQSRDFSGYRRRLAENAPTTQVAGADRQASGRLQANVEDRNAATASADRLTIAQGGSARAAETKLAQERQARERDTRTAELQKNITDLNSLMSASGAQGTPAAGANAPATPVTPATRAAGTAPATATTPTAPATTAPTAPTAPAAPAGTAPATPATAAAPNASPSAPIVLPSGTPSPLPSTTTTPAAPNAPAAVVATAPGAATPAAPAASAATTPAGPLGMPSAPTSAASAAATTPTPAASAPVAPPKPATAAKPPPAPERGFLDTLFENPIVLAAIALIALLIGFLAYRVLGRKKRPDTGDSVFLESRLPKDSFFGGTGGASVDTKNTSTSGSSSMSYSPSQLDAGDVDPVAEADVYLAYGRDLQAEEILREALRVNPGRTAIHLKLLEIHAKRRDLRAYEALAADVQKLTGGTGTEWNRVVEMGRELDPGNPLYESGLRSATSDGARTTAAAAAAGGFAAGAAAVMAPSPAPAAAVPPPPAFMPSVTPLDFDLDLDDSPATAPTVPSPLSASLPPSASARAEPQRDQPIEPMMDFDQDMDTTPGALEASAPRRSTSNANASTEPAPLRPQNDSGFIDFDMTAMSGLAKPSEADTDTVRGALDPALDEGGENPHAIKLSLARELQALGDIDGARALAEEVEAESAGELQAEAKALLGQLR